MIEPIIKQRGIAIKNGMTLLIDAIFIVIFNTGIIKSKEKIKVKGSSLSNFFGNKWKVNPINESNTSIKI